MISPLEEFYLKQPEPNRSCFEALRDIILRYAADITHEWKWGCPFFCYKGKVLCYLWKDKKTDTPYLGFTIIGLKDDVLFKGNRKRGQVLFVHPEKDIDLEALHRVLKKGIELLG